MKVNVVNHCDATTGEDIHKSSTIELFDVNVCIGGVGPVIEMLEADPTLAERLPFIKADKEEAKAFRWSSISDPGRRLFANWQVEAWTTCTSSRLRTRIKPGPPAVTPSTWWPAYEPIPVQSCAL